MNSDEITALSRKLVSAATEYDRREAARAARSKHGRHNPYALPQYFARIEEVCANIAQGAEVRPAIVAGFTGSLRNAFLKAAGLPKFNEDTDDESRSWCYVPAPVK
jgi:hypothetical protein